MCGKVLQEGHKIVFILLAAGIQGGLVGTVFRFVKIFKLQMPGYNGVAVNLFRDAAAHHELYPHVEYLVVIFPSAVNAFFLSNHALEGMLCLSVPGMLDDAAGNDLLSGFCQLGHDRTHQVEVFLAPEGYVVVACH